MQNKQPQRELAVNPTNRAGVDHEPNPWLHTLNKIKRQTIRVMPKIRPKAHKRLKTLSPRSLLFPNPPVNNKHYKRSKHSLKSHQFLYLKLF